MIFLSGTDTNRFFPRLQREPLRQSLSFRSVLPDACDVSSQQEDRFVAILYSLSVVA